MNKILRYSLVALMAMVMGNVYADDVTDVMTWESLGLDGSGSSYNEYSNIKLTSKAVYTAQASSGSGKYIQLRTNNNNSGIVATGSGGNLKSVTITFNEKTTDRAVEVYGKNEAYANAADLYGDAKGTLLGTIAANAESKTLTVEGEYTFVGLKSANAAIYVDKIEVTWTSGGGSTGEYWDVTSLTFDGNPPVLQDMTVTDNTDCVYIIPEDVHVFDEGTYPDNMNRVYEWLDANDKSKYAGTLKQYTFTATTTNISLKAVSTPNADAAVNESWQMSTKTNEAINTDDFPVKFSNYVKPKNGDPSLGSYDFYDKNSDGISTHRVTNNFWTPGCGTLPVKGCYYEFTSKSAGTLLLGVCMWKNLPDRPLYVIDESTAADGYTVLAPSKLTVEGVLQDNTWAGWHDKVYHKFTVGDDYKLYEENGEGTLEHAPNSRTFYGYVKFDVEPNKTYMVMNPNNQMGFFGFQFTPGGDPSGVETIKTNKVWNADAPMYNLSGQKVDKSYKGIVIQNGRKFVNK